FFVQVGNLHHGRAPHSFEPRHASCLPYPAHPFLPLAANPKGKQGEQPGKMAGGALRAEPHRLSHVGGCVAYYREPTRSPHADVDRRTPVPAAAGAVAPAGTDTGFASLLEDFRRDVDRSDRRQLLAPALIEFVPAALADTADPPF